MGGVVSVLKMPHARRAKLPEPSRASKARRFTTTKPARRDARSLFIASAGWPAPPGKEQFVHRSRHSPSLSQWLPGKPLARRKDFIGKRRLAQRAREGQAAGCQRDDRERSLSSLGVLVRLFPGQRRDQGRNLVAQSRLPRARPSDIAHDSGQGTAAGGIVTMLLGEIATRHAAEALAPSGDADRIDEPLPSLGHRAPQRALAHVVLRREVRVEAADSEPEGAHDLGDAGTGNAALLHDRRRGGEDPISRLALLLRS